MNNEKNAKDIDLEDVEQPVNVAEEFIDEKSVDSENVNMAESVESEVNGAEKMAGDVAEWRDKYLRLSAEFDNYRKRTLREKMELVSSASEEVLKALLPVMDDLERALAATEKVSDVNAVREGVVLINNKLRDTLKAKGLLEIEALGKELDTDFHDAVAKIPADKKQQGKVVDVVQKGYKLGDKVIRHCKVVVGE